MKSLLQTNIWAGFKRRWGWTVHQLELSDQVIPPPGGDQNRPFAERRRQPIFVLGRKLGFGRGMLYSPEVTLADPSVEQLRTLASEAKKLDNSAIFYRLELFEVLGEDGNAHPHATVAALSQAGYVKAFEETQPEHRQWVDIGGDETAILANMKEKGRYNVRLALRKGVKTRASTNISDVEVFYQLFQVTAARDSFRIRSKAYFLDLCQTLFDHQMGELIIAEYNGQPLVVLLITYYDGLASYLYGASSNEHRQLMAPYAAHWAAMQAAKKRGCQTYDLLQIAPPNAHVRGASEASADEQHPYTNLTRFKQQFGGRAVALAGGWDAVYRPMWYQTFKLAEQLRRH